MATSRRAPDFARALLGASVLVLPGCFSITLWEHAPYIEVKEVAGAEVDASRVLAVDLRYSNGEVARYHYALTGKAGDLIRVDRAGPPLPSRTFVVLPAPSSGVHLADDRFVHSEGLTLSLSMMKDLEITPTDRSDSTERLFVPDVGLDWSAPSNYGRAALAVPAVALDVVTFPIQLGVLCWFLASGARF